MMSRRLGTSTRHVPILVAAVLTMALVTAGCGGDFTDAEILEASGVRLAQTGTTLPGAESGGGIAIGGPDPTVTGTDGTTGGPGGGTAGGPAGGTTGGTDGTTGGTGIGDTPGTSANPLTSLRTPGETGPIVIGSVGNYSGPAGAAQGGIPLAVQVWAASVNARGGMFGRQVQVIVVDDGGDPARYASITRDLVENRGAVAFVGNGAALTIQASSYLQENGIPVIGGDCSRSEWLTIPVLFSQCPAPETQILAVVHNAVQLTGKKRFGYLVCTEAKTCTDNNPILVPDKIQGTGGQLVYKADISLTQVDFTAECRNAQQSQVEVFYIAADPNTVERVARSCERQGYHPQYSQASIQVDDDTPSVPGLENLALASTVFPFRGASGGAVDEYTQATRTFARGASGPAMSAGWAAAKMFELAAIRAVQAAGSLSPATLLAAMQTFDNETLGGLTIPLTFTSNTRNPPRCYFVMRGTGAEGWTAPQGAETACL